MHMLHSICISQFEEVISPSRRTMLDEPYRLLSPTDLPGLHRVNFLRLLRTERRPLPTVRLYRYARRYLVDTFDLTGRIADMRHMLRAVFGTLCGEWLYANLHEPMPLAALEARVLAFTDPFVPAPQVNPPVEPEQSDPRELQTAFNVYRRDEQRTARSALSQRLRSRSGIVNPQLFTHRWCVETQRLHPHDRLAKRLSYIFGPFAVPLLNTTTPIHRDQLATRLDDIQ